MRRKLFLNHIAGLDWLIALEFGRVDDGQPSENWARVTEEVGLLLDGPGGPPLGFKAVEFSAIDLEDAGAADLWRGPRFDAPVLGLTDAAMAEIMLAARTLFDGQNSANRMFFDSAVNLEGEGALVRWLACLQSGDSMAHFALGYTLHGLRRHHEAYRHLRHYTEISPCGTWNWRWFGVAAEAIGEHAEARAAYARAIELEQEGGEETDAGELLEALDERGAT